MRFFLAMLWLLWFVGYRCVQNEKQKQKELEQSIFSNKQDEWTLKMDSCNTYFFEGKISFGYDTVTIPLSEFDNKPKSPTINKSKQ